MTNKRSSVAQPPERSEAYLQIGEVAERTGVTQRTLRFYEEKGLLKPPSRLEGGFRLYSEDDVQRVEQIRRLQALLGFTLADIKEMVEAEEVKTQLRAEYRKDAEISERRAKIMRAIEVTERQVAVIEQKLSSLQEMKAGLDQKLLTYRGWVAQLDEKAAAAGAGAVDAAPDAR
ncbi:MAG: MerR family transcriptional regulator [Dehalococcoidia bacterium]|nr:MerR family transcriptional regulator [Dehalococcoidia bacterium]